MHSKPRGSFRALRAAGLCACLWAPLGLPAPRDAAPLAVTQLPAGAGAAERATAPLPEGARLVLVDPERPADAPRVLAPGFAAAGRADVSEDGRRLLFVGRRTPGERQQVWELALDGGEPRAVTQRAGDCLAALYLSTLFTIDAQAPEPRLGFCALAPDGAPQIYTCRTDGGDERQITFLPEGASAPLFTSDGRLVFVRGGAQGGALFAVNVDGTDVQAFGASRAVAPVRPWETADGRVLHVEGAELGDVLCSVALVRSLRTRSGLWTAPGARLASVADLPGGALLVARRSGPAQSWDLWRLGAGKATDQPVLATPNWHEVEVAPVAPRARRPGRSSVVDERVKYGFLYALDVLQSDLAPDGRLPDGSAAFVEVLARLTGGPEGARETLLGTAPVDADGSLYLKVPAQTPLRLRLRDAQGRVSPEMTSWIWVMPKESRGCIGCHEDRELTPPNRHVEALRRGPREIGDVR